MAAIKEVGLTKSAGYEIGLRKTFEIRVEEAWDKLFSPKGLQAWLGKVNIPLDKGTEYKTADGTEGKVRVFKPYSHIRLSWKTAEWKTASALQLRTIDAKGKCTVSFHQDKLSSAAQRKAMKAHWEAVMERLEKLL